MSARALVLLTEPAPTARRESRFRSTDRVEQARRIADLDARTDVRRPTRDAALGLHGLLWTCLATGNGRYLGTLADLERETGVDRRTLRRLLAVLTVAGLLDPVPGGWQVPRPEVLAGLEGRRGWERDPRSAYRVRYHRTALAVGGASSLPALAALGLYERLRCDPAARWRRNGPRIIGATPRSTRPALHAQVADRLGIPAATYRSRAAVLTIGGFLAVEGRGHRIAALADLHAAPDAAADQHPAARPDEPDQHPAARSTLTRKTGPELKDVDLEAGHGDEAQTGRSYDPQPQADGPKIDCQDNGKSKSSRKKENPEPGGDHPHLARLVADVIAAEPRYDWLQRRSDPARALFDGFLHRGLPWHELFDAAMSGRYWTGTAPTKVMAAHLAGHLEQRLSEAQGRAQWDRRPARTVPRWTGGSQRDAGSAVLTGPVWPVTPTPPPLAALDDHHDECVHGARSCARCPDCLNGRADELTGQTCTRCTPGSAEKTRETLRAAGTTAPALPDLDPVYVECVHGMPTCTCCPDCRVGRPDELTGQTCTRCTPRQAQAVSA